MRWPLRGYLLGIVAALITLPSSGAVTSYLRADDLQVQAARFVTDIDQAQLLCLSRNIYYEARGESPMGQLAVAFVTLNRTRNPDFPQTICGVVYQKDAFAWTRHRNAGHRSIYDTDAWLLATLVAKIAMSGLAEDPTAGAVDFHATDVKPYWRSDKTVAVVIGHHKFYKRQSSTEHFR